MKQIDFEGTARVVIVVIVILALAAMVIGNKRCIDDGGQYVRGLVWFECIK